MSNSPLTARVPGKLMIAGEFAVLEPYQKLAVMAVDRFVYATLEEKGENLVSLDAYDLRGLAWTYKAGAVDVKTDDSRISFIENAMSVVYTYLLENHVTPNYFHLSIRSELDDASGRKYGLGSSAAAVTSVVYIMLAKYLCEKPSEPLVFKLAAMSHVLTQGSGSGADVAASSYGGWLEYSSFQADWLTTMYEQTDSITELVEKDWPYFSITPIDLPEDIHMCIGWTGSPASTSELVGKISTLKRSCPAVYNDFLSNSQQAVTTFLHGFQTGESASVIEGIRQNRNALESLGKNADTAIETPTLTTLCDLAEAFGGAGKPSGAGGGDCGIAFMPSKEKAKQLLQTWKEAGIKPLDMHPCKTGASLV
ncbi:phosphomevalonate kinase [Lentibacillus halophilus]|uniref:phosphomevalonate kinase n=1 Tax=Lentibacillus halophilus TaxID=295065 RepID=A0ABN0Z3Q8_9BACI